MAKPDLDLSKYRTAAGAAKALHKWLIERAEADRARLEDIGVNPRYAPSPEGIVLRSPAEAGIEWAQNGWHVVWEGGPYEWAYALTNGSSMFEHEYGSELRAMGAKTAGPEVVGFSGPGWIAQPGYSFSILFTNY